MFSYGSGLASTMMSFKAVGNNSEFEHMKKVIDLSARLSSRRIIQPTEFEQVFYFINVRFCLSVKTRIYYTVTSQVQIFIAFFLEHSI